MIHVIWSKGKYPFGRFIVAIAGLPISSKSTMAADLARINAGKDDANLIPVLALFDLSFVSLCPRRP